MLFCCTSCTSYDFFRCVSRDAPLSWNVGKVCDFADVAQHAPIATLTGSEQSPEACTVTCYNQPQCTYFNYDTVTDSCTMFQRCSSTTTVGSGAQIATYVRSEAVMSDVFSQVGDMGNGRCDYADVSQRATYSQLDGGMNAFVDCLAACYTRGDCNYFVYTEGYCDLFSTCKNTVPSLNSVTHGRNTKANVHGQLHEVCPCNGNQ